MVTQKKYSHFNRIGITGSPGTGKKSVGKELAEITDLQFFSLNDYVIGNHLATQKKGEYSVDVRKFRGKIKTKNRIVVGHLLPYLIPDKALDLVVILRCSPVELRKRYEFREYTEEKIIENIEAELIGAIAHKATQRYSRHKLAEFDTTKTKPVTIARRISNIIKGKNGPAFGSIDWLSVSSPSAFTELLLGKCNRLNTPKRISGFANRTARKSTY